MVARHPRVKRALLDNGQERSQGCRRDAFAPERLSNPVSDLSMAVLNPTRDVTGDVVVQENSPRNARVVVEDLLLPVSNVSGVVARREGSHRRSVGVALMVVEDVNIRLLNDPQLMLLEYPVYGRAPYKMRYGFRRVTDRGPGVWPVGGPVGRRPGPLLKVARKLQDFTRGAKEGFGRLNRRR